MKGIEDMEHNQKDEAKGKIILFIIGALFGAIVATSAFLICVNVLGVNESSAQTSQTQGGGGTPPEMPSGQNDQNGTPPAKPSESDSQSENS